MLAETLYYLKVFHSAMDTEQDVHFFVWSVKEADGGLMESQMGLGNEPEGNKCL